MRGVIGLFLLGILAVSCLEEPDCLNLVNNVVGITFKNIEGGQVLAQQFNIVGMDTTERILFRDSAASKIGLPMDYFNDSTSYMLVIQDTVYKLVFKYVSQPQFVSGDCGERYELSSLQLVQHSFDSVRFLSDEPGVNNDANNIEIFR